MDPPPARSYGFLYDRLDGSIGLRYIWITEADMMANSFRPGTFAHHPLGWVKILRVWPGGRVQIVHSNERHTTRRGDVPFDVDPKQWGLVVCTCISCSVASE